MKNPTGNKLEKLVFRIFDQMVEGADKYVTKQGSTWLIFTESRKWVIEFTKDKTLWFNYNIFQNELDLIGKDCTEERDLIKNWFESRFLNKPKVEETKKRRLCPSPLVEDTIQNGVKETRTFNSPPIKSIEDTIENGVKRTFDMEFRNQLSVEDTIENGVKHTLFDNSDQRQRVENTIQNGVKEINKSGNIRVKYVEDIIQNGVKQVKTPGEDGDLLGFLDFMSDNNTDSVPQLIEDTIENGVKDVRTPGVGDLESTMDFMNENNTLDVQKLLDDVIENGVKETKENRLLRTINVISTIKNGVKEIQPLPAQDGNRDWGLYYHRQEDRTKPHTEYVKEVIEDSYNHRGRIEGIIRNTDKDGI